MNIEKIKDFRVNSFLLKNQPESRYIELYIDNHSRVDVIIIIGIAAAAVLSVFRVSLLLIVGGVAAVSKETK